MRPLRLFMATLVLTLVLGHGRALAEGPRVVVSIKPIHSLVAALLEGIAEPLLVLDGAQSPHSFAMRPSASRALRQADVAVWVGPELEGFLAKSVSVLPDSVRLVTLLTDVPRLERLHLDNHDGHDGHDNHKGYDAAHSAHDHAQKAEGGLDPHIWLSPANARAIANHLAGVLRGLGDDARLVANAAALDQRLATLDRSLTQQLAPVKNRPFVVMHPAYNYLIRAYGLHQAGVIAHLPEQGASAGHLAELREHIAEEAAMCIFAEPQFGDRQVQALARQLNLRVSILDPMGAAIPAGPQAYPTTMQAIADALTDCLAR